MKCEEVVILVKQLGIFIFRKQHSKFGERVMQFHIRVACTGMDYQFVPVTGRATISLIVHRNTTSRLLLVIEY
jgi:hypothetical protein